MITLADNIGALLATSICGHGLFADNQWSLGISGGFSSPAADELISESDLILGFGVSFTQWTTKKGKLIGPGATVAQIDIEAPKLGYQMPVQYALLGDAKATAEALLAELGLRKASSARSGRRNEVTRERIRSGDNHHSPHPDELDARYIDPRTLSKAVDEILPKDRVVASIPDISADGFRATFGSPVRKRHVSVIHFNRLALAWHPRLVLPSQIQASLPCWVRATVGS